MSTFAPTFETETSALELETRGRPSAAPRAVRSKPAPRPPYGPHWPHWAPWRRRRVIGPRYSLVGPSYAPEPDGTEPGALRDQAQSASSEYVRWVQDSLNRALGSALAVDGVMTGSVRRCIRAFQRRAGLPVSGFIGPDTESALRGAGRDSDQRELEFESELSGEALTADHALAAARAQPVAFALKSLGKTKIGGLYRFHTPDGRFYTGKAVDLRRRIIQHLWCLSHFGQSARGFRLALYRMQDKTKEHIRALESSINQHYKSDPKRLNAVTELEVLQLNEI